MGLCIDITTSLSIEERKESIVISDNQNSAEFYKSDVQNLIEFFKTRPELLKVR